MQFQQVTVNFRGEVTKVCARSDRSLGRGAVEVFRSVLEEYGDGFHVLIPHPFFEEYSLRFTAIGESSAIATFLYCGTLLSISALLCGDEPANDGIGLARLQNVLVGTRHLTGVEPSFALSRIEERPAIVTLELPLPPTSEQTRKYGQEMAVCLACAYFAERGF
jgi:hypothetical protein